MSVTERAYKPTPPEKLQHQIMSESIPKNEREWWAKRRIEDLEHEVSKLKMMIDNGLGLEDLQDDIGYPDSVE